ncbi:MAG: bile acid:sodium symporter [Luteolibacter sp.]
MEFLQKITPFVMLVFVVSSMLAVGLGLTVSQIVAPLRSIKLVSVALVANFVIMPAVAIGLAKVLRLEEPLGVGLLLLGMAAGAPFLPKLAQNAKGNVAFSVGLMVLLMVVTVGFLPLVLPLLLPGVSVDPGKIARSLVLLMLLPLAVALLVNAKFPNIASRAKPPLAKISGMTLLMVIGLFVVGNFSSVLSVFGTGGIFASILFVTIALALGWFLGGSSADVRSVLGLGTAQRNIAAAVVVASQSFTDPKVVIMVVVTAIVGLVVLMPLSKKLGASKA